MVQSDIPKGQTSSGKINARWYLQRLKASAANRTSSSSSKQTIRIVKGSTPQSTTYSNYFSSIGFT